MRGNLGQQMHCQEVIFQRRNGQSRHLSSGVCTNTSSTKPFLATLQTNMAAPVGTLEDQAKKRKERLAALKCKRGAEKSEDEPADKKIAGEEAKLPK